MGREQELTNEILHHYLSMVRRQHRIGHHLRKEFSISGRQSAVLTFLVDHCPATVKSISRYLYVSDSTTSPLLERMEQAGYVTRHRSAKDNRKVLVEPTDRGRELIASVPPTMTESLRQKLPTIDLEELEQIAQAMARLAALGGVDDDKCRREA